MSVFLSSHGENRSHWIQGGNKNATLTDTSCQKEGPCGFPIGLPMAKDLPRTHKFKTMQCTSRGQCEFADRLTRSAGTMPSLAMAWSRRGAPVKLWRPAPHVEKKDPITMTHGDGQAKVPITRFPCTPSPNLKRAEERKQRTWSLVPHCPNFSVSESQAWTYLSLRTTPSMQAPKRITLVMSEQLWLRNPISQIKVSHFLLNLVFCLVCCSLFNWLIGKWSQ